MNAPMTCQRLVLTLGRGLGFLLAVYVPSFALASALVASRAGTAGDEGAAAAAAIPLVMALSLAIALLLVAGITGGRFGSFGFRGVALKPLLLSLGLGVGFGILLRWLATALNVQESAFPFAGLAGWQLVALSWLAAPIQEEIIFRGLLQTTLQSGIPGLITIGPRKLSVAGLVAAIVFALVHCALLGMGVPAGAAVFIALGALVLGVVAGQMRWSTGSLVPAVVVHALFNIIGSI